MLYLAVREVTPDMFAGLTSTPDKLDALKRLTAAFADECKQAFPDITVVDRLWSSYALVLELPDADTEALAERIGNALKCEMHANHEEVLAISKSAPVA